MTLYILKPIFWNSNNYKTPSGAKAYGGYPKETGYGHEEWNNSSKMIYKKNGNNYRVFHAHMRNDFIFNNLSRRKFIIMYASYQSVQYMVGIAANSIHIQDKLNEIEKIVKDLSIDNFSKDAWGVQTTKSAFNHKEKDFIKRWKSELLMLPNWMCVDELFLWFEEPVPIYSDKITGKSKFLTMYSRHTVVSPKIVRKILLSVPLDKRCKNWDRIFNSIGDFSEDSQSDIDDIESNENLGPATKMALIEARRGQGKFRQNLDNRWDGRCAVTKCTIREVLRASHIKPWKESLNKEKLDSCNGLLLSANLDALFDKGLISFGNDGEMLVSKLIDKKNIQLLGVPKSICKKLNEGEKKYLTYHRSEIFLDDIVF